MVVAVIFSLLFVGGLAVVGCGGLMWLLMGNQNAPVAQAPPPQQVDRDDGGVRLAPREPDAGDRLAPPLPNLDGPPMKQGGGPRAPLPGDTGVRVPPTPPRPLVKPPVLTERKALPLPGEAERVIPAGGGRFLVCHFPKLRKVGIFDLNEMKFARFIDLAEDKPLITAGMSKLVVYLRSAKLIQRYDLATGNREANKPLDVPDVKAIAVGSASAGPLVVSAGGGGRLFDVDTLTEMELPKEEVRDQFGGGPPPGPRRLPFAGDKLWAAANGRLFIGSAAYSSGAIALQGNQVTFKQGHGETWVYAQPSADAKYVFRAGSGAVTADGQKTQDVVHSAPGGGGHAGYFFLPAVDGPFYFHVHFAGGGLGAHDPKFAKDPKRAVTVYMYGLDAPLARVLDVQDVRDWNAVNVTGLPFSEHIHVIPRARVLVTIGPSGDRLTFIPLDLNQALDEAGIDFLMVTSSPPGTFCPGKELQYPIRVRSKAGGLKYTLESGPDGMKVSPNGVVTWKVPEKFDEPEASIIVAVKDAAGKEAFHNFRLTKSDTPEVYQPDTEPEPVKAAPTKSRKSQGPRIPYRLRPAPPAPEMGVPGIAGRTEVRIPDRFDRVVPGGGGRFLVLHAASAHKAFVFDVSAGAVARTIELSDDRAVIAAGMTQLLVYRPSDNSIEKFALTTGASDGKTLIPTKGVTEMVMGSASAGPLFVRSAEHTELYDVESLTMMDVPESDGFPFAQGPVWVSADGRVFGNTMTRAAGSFVRVAVLWPDRVRASSVLATARHVAPADDTKVFVAGYGEFTAELQPAPSHSRPLSEGSDPAYFFLPAGGAYFLVLHAGVAAPPYLRGLKETKSGVSVWHRDQRRAIATLDVAEMTADLRENPALPSLVHFHAEIRVLVTVPPSNDRLVLYPVKLDGGSTPKKAAPVRPKTPAKTTPKRQPTDEGPVPQPSPVASGKPFKLAPLPEPLPINPVTETKTIKIEIENVAGSMSPVIVRSGGGGRFLLIQWHGRKIDVFDLNEARVVRRIDLPTEFTTHWAAGMTKLVVSDQNLRTLYRFDLLTGKEELKKDYVNQVYVEAMGAASDGPVLCHTTQGLRFVDVDTLELMNLAGPDLAGREYWNKTFWASLDGRAFGVGMGGFRAGGVGPQSATVTLSVGAASAKKAVGQFPSMYAVPDPTGRYLFAGGHGVYDLSFGKVKEVVRSEDPSPAEPVHLYLPALDGPFYMRYVPLNMPDAPGRPGGPPRAGGPEPADTGVSIYAYGQSKPVVQIKDVDPVGRWFDPFALARVSTQLVLIPRAKVLVVFQPLSREMTVRLVPVDLEAEMAKSGVEVPWVASVPPRTFKPGEDVKYPLKVMSKAGGLKYALENPSSGMAVSAEGVFTWKPPADVPTEVRVVVRVADAKGGASMHSFLLTRP